MKKDTLKTDLKGIAKARQGKTIRILELYISQMIIANQQKHDRNRANFITEVNEHISELKEIHEKL